MLGLGACQARITALPALDAKAIKTAAAATVNAFITEDAASSTTTPELLSTSTSLPTATPFPTASPIPAAIAGILPSSCAQRPMVDFQNYFYWSLLPQQYGDTNCKLPVLSPNGKYLAYVTLAKKADNNVYFVDTVRVLKITSTGRDNEIYSAHQRNYITALEWSPTGQLIIWESIWEGPWVVFVYDPHKDTVQASMWLNQDDTLQWNSQHSAFYAKHTGEYGPTQCIQDLGGYDSETGQSFPNLYQLFGITEKEKPFFGILSGENDQLSVEPFGWSKDGKQLWLTVTILKWNDGQYQLGPKEAGMLELTGNGITYRRLAADPHYDYSFNGSPEPAIISQTYQPQTCPKQ